MRLNAKTGLLSWPFQGQILAFLFFVWPQKNCLAIWLIFGLFQKSHLNSISFIFEMKNSIFFHVLLTFMLRKDNLLVAVFADVRLAMRCS